MRGNPDLHLRERAGKRSIPAYAGEPGNGQVRQSESWVYPRVCGGTDLENRDRKRGHGLSPRMRGNLSAPPIVLIVVGSIPAYAGEPG